MVVIDKDYFDSRFPIVGDSYIDELDENSQKGYLLMYSLYMHFFYEYLLKNTSIKDFDQQLETNSDYKFIEIEDKEKDMYQYLANGKLKFYYIRNNIHLEQLDEGELEYLRKLSQSDNKSLTPEIEEFIGRTFKKAIFENSGGNLEKNIKINFGPSDNFDFYSSNDSLVIGQRYYEVLENPDDDEEFDNYYKRQDFSDECRQKLASTLKNELNIEASVIKYTDYSIKKKASLGDDTPAR